MIDDAIVGRCPNCGHRLPRSSVLIEYERSTGRTMYAGCPECRDVVHPE